MYLVVSTSLISASRSRNLGRRIFELLSNMNVAAEAVDLAAYSLPIHDGSTSSQHTDVHELEHAIGRAAGLILVTPIYQSDVAVAARNLIQLTGPAWKQKVVGFACVAGGPANYAAVLGLANILMLEHRAFILPDFVFADSHAFAQNGDVIDAGVQRRLQRLSRTLVRVTEALKAA